jgi:hypothetical protein
LGVYLGIKFCRNVFTVLKFKGGRPLFNQNPGYSKITSPTGSGTPRGTTESNQQKKEEK